MKDLIKYFPYSERKYKSLERALKRGHRMARGSMNHETKEYILSKINLTNNDRIKTTWKRVLLLVDELEVIKCSH